MEKSNAVNDAVAPTIEPGWPAYPIASPGMTEVCTDLMRWYDPGMHLYNGKEYTMILGQDNGYDAIKVVTRDKQVSFKSLVGPYKPSLFSLNGRHDIVLVDEAGQWVVGDGAVGQSLFLKRREEGDWYRTADYRRLMLAGFGQATSARGVRLLVVTGLPVSYYQPGKAEVEALFSGVHRVELLNRPAQRIEVELCRVVPQPFGTIFDQAMDSNGRVVDRELAQGPTGVIDIGGKTTNLLQMSNFRDDSARITAINLGAWDLVRAVQEHLNRDYPDLEVSEPELMTAVRAGQIWYHDRFVDLTPAIEPMLAEMGEVIEATARQLWRGGANLRRLLLTGGGANLLGPRLQQVFRQAELVPDSRFANARGYWKYGTFLEAHR